MLAHIAEIVGDRLPVNADFESGYAHEPGGWRRTFACASRPGSSGLSIEDSTGDQAKPLYDLALGVDRIRAAREAIDATGTGVLLTGRPNATSWATRIRWKGRSAAWRRTRRPARTCSTRPGRAAQEIAAIVGSVAPKPVNDLMSAPSELTVADLAGMGVRRSASAPLSRAQPGAASCAQPRRSPGAAASTALPATGRSPTSATSSETISEAVVLADLSEWTPRPCPERRVFEGRYARLEPLDPVRHGDDLYAAAGPGAEDRFRYLFDAPPDSRAAFEPWLARAAASDDPLYFAVVDRDTGRAEGRMTFMRIDRTHGVIETGNILFGPRLARTRGATEAVYLQARHAFEDLGYRRFEWKCNDLNERSKRAAERLGFTFEGVFGSIWS